LHSSIVDEEITQCIAVVDNNINQLQVAGGWSIHGDAQLNQIQDKLVLQNLLDLRVAWLQVIKYILQGAGSYLSESQLFILLPEHHCQFSYYMAIEPVRIIISVSFGGNRNRSNN